MNLKTNITGITSDSRKVKAGYLFAALPPVPNGTLDGRDFIPQAIKRGARAILTLTGSDIPSLICHSERSEESQCREGDPSALPQDDKERDIEWIFDDNPRRAYALMCAAFYQKQPEVIVAATGTNGKTSVVNFVWQLWEILGVKGASLGTLGIKTAEEYIEGAMTTPDAQIMHETLANLSKGGITHVALEASSHGLDQYRLDGVKIQAAAFTNLTQDHLDYHGDMEIYFKAKARLFSEVMSDNGTAVINADMAYYSQIKNLCAKRDLNIFDYGQNAKALISYDPPEEIAEGYKLKFRVKEESFSITLPLVGRFQIDNALAALGLVHAEGKHALADIVSALEKLKPVHGRLEYVAGHPKGAGVYVDYAHTPDALENALQSLRGHAKGKLICVFGCGGDRDKTKRPLMAAAAEEYSDVAILTDDNPRSEDPAAIRADALEGYPQALEIGDRRKAIEAAIEMASADDVVLIAGKGHEQGQEIKGIKHPFDDVTEVQKAVKLLS